MSHFVVKSELMCQDPFEAFKNAWTEVRDPRPVQPWRGLCGVSGEAVSSMGQEKPPC